MFIDDIKATKEIYQKIIDGKRLAGPEKKHLDELKNKYGINENGRINYEKNYISMENRGRYIQETLPLIQSPYR